MIKILQQQQQDINTECSSKQNNLKTTKHDLDAFLVQNR